MGTFSALVSIEPSNVLNANPIFTDSRRTAMTTLTIKDLSATEELDREARASVHGGSIYVDGQYWGEGQLDLRPWPGGNPVWNVWSDGTRTPH
jgi:hypothetical protein